MTLKLSKKILFTGAGFTADFGGFLAIEMWSKIFNNKNLEKYPRIKKILRDNFDFEFVYWLITSDATYSTDEKNALRVAIVEAYLNMDSNIMNNLRHARLGNLFNIFTKDSTTVSVHFTLNQDLLMERLSKRQPLGLTTSKYKNYLDKIQADKIDAAVTTQLPDNSFLEEFKTNHLNSSGNLFFVKLHGSCDWISADGSNAIVIGYEKPKDISAEPLLKWYFELFNQAINVGDAKILIIGYSFGDKHINVELAKAVNNSGLKIYIVSPEHPLKLKEKVNGFYKSNTHDVNEVATDCGLIWKAVDGYFPYKVKELFPEDGSTSNARTDLLKIFS